MRNTRLHFGFSLIEVLMAVAILAVLATLVLGLGARIRTQANEKLAASTIGILVAALEQYYDFCGEFPAQNGSNQIDDSEGLFSQLDGVLVSRRLCEQIHSSQIGDTDTDSKMEFIDPWGKALYYTYSVGDNFPVVLSAGVDGDPNTLANNVSSR